MPTTPKPVIDTLNKWFVSVDARHVRIIGSVPRTMDAHDAMVFAAYIVSLAQALPDAPAFEDVLAAVQNA